jgi:NADPH:quinone reductase-like Zn-dependent oxidoreductase
MKNLPEVMQGVWLTGHGGYDKLEVRDDIPLPRPTGTDVLVKVAAAGVNNTDINTRMAWYSKEDGAGSDASWCGEPITFPRIQGADVCGTIVAVADGVDKSRVGERVLLEPCIREVHGKTLVSPWYFGSECDGGFAEYALIAGRHAHTITSPLTDIELASFPCSYSTAENLLTRSGVSQNERILVTGASGGVGSAVLQLARLRGARVIAVAAEEKCPEMLSLGAAEALVRDAGITESLGSNSIDVVIDLVAGRQWPEFLEVLKPGGRYATAGAIGGPLVELDVRTLYLKDLSLFGCTVLGSSVFANLVAHIESGDIKPLVAQSFPLDQIVQAQEMFLEKRHVGKIVLSVSS